MKNKLGEINPLKKLDHEVRWLILDTLSDKRKLNQTQIQEMLIDIQGKPFPKSTLQHHLKKLESLGMIKSEQTNYLFTGNPTFYELTQLGNMELDSKFLADEIINFTKKREEANLNTTMNDICCYFMDKHFGFPSILQALMYLKPLDNIGVVGIKDSQ